VAFGGTRAVRGVEVSIDGGKTWQQAQLVVRIWVALPGASSYCPSSLQQAPMCWPAVPLMPAAMCSPRVGWTTLRGTTTPVG
jgi:hypothetical protein